MCLRHEAADSILRELETVQYIFRHRTGDVFNLKPSLRKILDNYVRNVQLKVLQN